MKLNPDHLQVIHSEQVSIKRENKTFTCQSRSSSCDHPVLIRKSVHQNPYYFQSIHLIKGSCIQHGRETPNLLISQHTKIIPNCHRDHLQQQSSSQQIILSYQTNKLRLKSNRVALRDSQLYQGTYLHQDIVLQVAFTDSFSAQIVIASVQMALN